MTKEYRVLLTEHLVYEFRVKAGSEEEAKELALDMPVSKANDIDVIWSEVSAEEV